MKKFGIFYGSSTGTCKDVAERIAKRLDVAPEDIHDVAKTAPDAVADYEVLVLGSSTWGSGELQDDWYDFSSGLASLFLKGKKTALFGVGDETMSETFCGAVGELYKRIVPTQTDFIGFFPADCYEYNVSPAEIDGNIVGLLLDEVNKPELTDNRIAKWTEQIKKEA